MQFHQNLINFLKIKGLQQNHFSNEMQVLLNEVYQLGVEAGTEGIHEALEENTSISVNESIISAFKKIK